MKVTTKKINKIKNGENVPDLEITEVILIHCNIINIDYQHDAKYLYTSVPDKSFGKFLYISPKNFIFLRNFKILIQSFLISKCGLLIKNLNRYKQRIK